MFSSESAPEWAWQRSQLVTLACISSQKMKMQNKVSLLTPDPPPVPAVMTITTSTRSPNFAPGQA